MPLFALLAQCAHKTCRQEHGFDKAGMPAVNDGFPYLISEQDCLNLAIYVPDLAAPPPTGGIPVVVHIHGGRLRHGGNAHPVYGRTQPSFCIFFFFFWV